jgi:hypothetical protein
VPHHTNSRTSIGGADRHVIWDLHAMDTPEDRGGLAECWDPVRAMVRAAYRARTAGTAR